MLTGQKISICLLAFLVCFTTTQKVETCDLENEFCYPLENLSFVEKFKKITTDMKLNAAKESSSSDIFEKKVYPKMKHTGKVSFFAKENIKKNETIINAQVSSTLQDKILYDSFTPDADNTFSSVHKILRKVDFKHEKEDLLKPVELRALHTLLYHIYHVEYSPFKNDLMNLPLENNMVLLRMNPEEIQFINDPSLREAIVHLKNTLKKSYLFYRQRINLVWNVADCISFFERDYVPFQDFAYAFYIFRTTYQVFQNEEDDEPVFLFVPAYSMFHNLDVTDADVIHPLVYKKNPESPKSLQWGTIEFRAIKDFNKDEEIFTYFPFEDSLKIYLKNSVVMRDNHFDCTAIQIADDYYSTLFNFANFTCFGIGHVHTLYAFGNMANMDGFDLAQCKKKIEQNKNKFMPDVIIEDCAHPAWDTIDMFNISRTNLQIKYDDILLTIKTLEEMYEYIKERGKESDINENIIKIYKNKAKGIENIFNEMKRFMKINAEKNLKYQANENDELDDLDEKSEL